MKRKNLISKLTVVVMLVALLFTVGCSTFRPLESNVSFPGDGSKYRILGRVTLEANLNRAGAGYNLLLKEAMDLYPEADDVVNIIVDAKGKSAKKLDYVVMSGIAIDYLEMD